MLIFIVSGPARALFRCIRDRGVTSLSSNPTLNLILNPLEQALKQKMTSFEITFSNKN